MRQRAVQHKAGKGGGEGSWDCKESFAPLLLALEKLFMQSVYAFEAFDNFSTRNCFRNLKTRRLMMLAAAQSGRQSKKMVGVAGSI